MIAWLRRLHEDERGVGLVEALVSSALLGIALMGLMASLSTFALTSRGAEDRALGQAMARAQAARIVAAPYVASGDYSALYDALPTGFTPHGHVDVVERDQRMDGDPECERARVVRAHDQAERQPTQLPGIREVVAMIGFVRSLHADTRGVSLTELLVGTLIGALIMGVVATTIFTSEGVRLHADDRSQFAADLSTSLSFDRDGVMATAGATAKAQTASTSCATVMDLGFLEGGASVRYRTVSGNLERISGSGTRKMVRNVSGCTWQAVRGRKPVATRS